VAAVDELTAAGPPHNLDAEQSVLGGMLLNKDAIADVVEILAPEDFYRGVNARIFETLARESINIRMISTGEIRVTCIIDRDRVEDAVRALHRAFELDLL